MFKRYITGIFIIFCFIGVFYLALPNYNFPDPPPDALQSQEPADTEILSVRRAYFTNYDRQEILNWYQSQLEKKTFLGISIPSYLLNYPPEEAQTIIRDQTRSSFLQEVLHPFRESIYINGFKAQSENDTILIDNKVWLYKITIRYVPSSVWLREAVFIAAVGMMIIVYNAFEKGLQKRNGKN